MPKQSQKRSSKNQRRPRHRGGAGAAEHAISVYGNTDAQTAGPNGAIAVNIPHNVQTGGSTSSPLVPASYTTGGSLAPLAPSQAGGNRKSGGNVFNNLAVPAALLYANQMMGKRRRTFKQKSYRKKLGRKRTFRRRR